VTGVEKHAQAILDLHCEHRTGPPFCDACEDDWPCATRKLAEAVLVAAREHDTRQAKAIELLAPLAEQSIAANPYGNQDTIRAALRLLRGGEA
jgi:hypothetical protein